MRKITTVEMPPVYITVELSYCLHLKEVVYDSKNGHRDKEILSCLQHT